MSDKIGNRIADDILLEERRDGLIAEIEQVRIDVESWNDMHPEAPIDWDPDGEMQKALDDLRKLKIDIEGNGGGKGGVA